MIGLVAMGFLVVLCVGAAAAGILAALSDESHARVRYAQADGPAAPIPARTVLPARGTTAAPVIDLSVYRARRRAS